MENKKRLESFAKFEDKALIINEGISEEVEREASKAAHSLIESVEQFLVKLDKGKVSKEQIAAIKEANSLIKKVIK